MPHKRKSHVAMDIEERVAMESLLAHGFRVVACIDPQQYSCYDHPTCKDVKEHAWREATLFMAQHVAIGPPSKCVCVCVHSLNILISEPDKPWMLKDLLSVLDKCMEYMVNKVHEGGFDDTLQYVHCECFHPTCDYLLCGYASV